MEGVVLQKIREWCPKSQLRGGSFDRAYDKILRTVKFKNGSWMQFFSNDQDRDKFGGAALHRVVYDEEPRADIRQECIFRLIDYGGDEVFAMTPFSGMSWLYDEIYEPWKKGDIPEESVVIVDMDENPHLSSQEIARATSGLTSQELQARKSGRFVSFEGLIYPEWDQDRHVIPVTEDLPADQDGIVVVECFAGVDPGIRVMCAVVFAYLTDDNTMVVYDELALQGKTIREVCAHIQLKNARWKQTPRWYVIDPAARNKNHQTGRSDQQEFWDNGIATLPGQNGVTAGINRVKERLQADKLLVMAHCRETIREFSRYRWAPNGRSGSNDPREAPVKKDDHVLDALRYVCMSRPLPPLVEQRAPSLTLKDRMLRDSLRVFDNHRSDHASGPGFLA